MTLAELKKRLESLSPTAIRFVGRMVDSLSSPPAARLSDSETWLTAVPEWVEYFGLALSVHHGTTTEPLAQKGFEAVFRNACEAVEWDVGEAASETQRFLDLALRRGDLPEQKLSLKSTAAKNISRSTAHISKLTDAAWVQDMRTARERRDRTLELFRAYAEAVDAIMMLRAFRKGQEIPVRYQLLEIPTAIFRSLQDAPVAAFNADGPTIDCAYEGSPAAARVSLDRSDAKITVKQIRLSVCTVHAEWQMTGT